ncbi:FGGY family carbohydrate kinase [Blastococcus sp. CT_GayMR16]|uniref:FGGY family carbohydrate kinase n=1 Tax=Blastococcus sp. CT_GayMR16 TaxID=2559607 RepID=UPI001072EDCE|nr:FGGY family carbohydrate kinase [Blastococcus sp. CT_GayMR16]TFV89212.1 carbohydrate kinase [Blastococcus sp. CT_GayMR16]
MADDVLLGADLGTSGLKLVALDVSGRVVAEAERGYPIDRPAPGRAESDVGAWRHAFDEALSAVAPAVAGARVLGLGLSGQMHGLVVVDAAGRALRPAVLWADGRAAAELDLWRALPDADRAALANPLVAGMTGPLLAWLARHEPETVARAATVLLPKDALRATLLPESPPAVTDRSDASATLLWDVPADDWSAAAVRAAGVDPGLLPAVRPTTEVLGTADLPVGAVPVVTGGADTPLALLAAGSPVAQVNLGTGAQLLRPGWAPRPAVAPLVHGYADVSGGWYAMAALQNGGSAWDWVCGVLGLSWTELFDAAGATPAGAGGVAFRPFLTGERGGVARPSDRGGWSGLHPGTTRADLARAAVEGVAFAIGAAFELLEVPGSDEPVVLTGGGARSAVVQGLLADVLGRPVRHLPLRSASAIGAALLAGRGVGQDVVLEGAAGAVVEPHADVDLGAAADRWART